MEPTKPTTPPPYNEFDDAPSYDEVSDDNDIYLDDAQNPGQLDRRFSDSQNGTIYNIKHVAMFSHKYEVSYAENNDLVYTCKPRKTFALTGMILLDAADDRPLCQTKRDKYFSFEFCFNYLAKSPISHPERIVARRERAVKTCYTFDWEGKITLTWRHKSLYELRCRLQRILPEASTSTDTSNVASSSQGVKKQDKSERTYVAFYRHHIVGPSELRIVESMLDGLIEDKQGCYHMLILSVIYIRVLLQSKSTGSGSGGS
ncbi:hypothetical protein K7432_007112 [Basidiobolus ranarum]|uniref:Uncharacterized protein n=1 Tax=Basidiobolus ranarum TaxID=34480 RepID=A0ABR2WTT4_9FUNG